MKYSDFLKVVKDCLLTPDTDPSRDHPEYEPSWMCGAVTLASRKCFGRAETPSQIRAIDSIHAEIRRLKSALPVGSPEHLQHTGYYPGLVAYFRGVERGREFDQTVRHSFMDLLIEQALEEEAREEAGTGGSK